MNFGLYAAGYSIALVNSVIVEYGFNLTGTRDVAVASVEERRRVVSRISAAKSVLILPAFLLGIIACSFNSNMSQNFILGGLSAALGCSIGASSFWYFQGVGRAKTGVLIEVTVQVVGVVATLFFVHHPSDLNAAIAIQLICTTLGALWGAYIMFKSEGASRVTIPEICETLKDGFVIFLSRGAITIYSSASVFMLSAWGSASAAAFYGAADRIVGALSSLLRPMSSVVMPRLARLMHADAGAGMRSSLNILWITIAIFAFVGLGTAFTSPFAVHVLFGDKFSESSSILRILSVTIPIVAANTVLGSQILIAGRKDLWVLSTLFLGALVSVVGAWALVPLAGAHGMALNRILSEGVVTLGYLLGLRRMIQVTRAKGV